MEAEATTVAATEVPQAQEVKIELTPEQEAKYELITRDLEEIVGENDFRQILKDGRDVRIYWGTATTGKPHLGYFVPIYKISDFLAAGCHVTILFADLHAYLDNLKSDWELLKLRCEWYEFIIKEMLTYIGVPLDKLKFIRGTEYQLSNKYTMDMYRMSALVTTEHTKKAGAEVVKMTAAPLMSNLLYPILQALDEEYLDVDVQFGGVDQRKIFMFARENLPRIGYRKRAHLMNPLIPGLGESGKMSSSEPLSKVELDETTTAIQHKINQAFAREGVAQGNGLLAILKHILFRFLDKHGRPFIAPRPDKYGGPQIFKSYADVEAAFVLPSGAEGKLMAGDLKSGVRDLLDEFLAPLRAKIDERVELASRAYPHLQPVPIPVAGAAAEAAIKKKAIAVAAAPKKGKVATAVLGPQSLEVKVGRIVDVKKHEQADSLYVELIDVGEDKPRTIVSGLVNYIPLEKMQNRLVLVCTNLQPAPLRGVVSEGMVLAATKRDKKEVLGLDLVNPPEGARVGETVFFEDDTSEPDRPSISNARLKKLLKDLRTDGEGKALWKDSPFMTSAGPCTSTVSDATIS
jgi:tyrosyl-tRNA synthetase